MSTKVRPALTELQVAAAQAKAVIAAQNISPTDTAFLRSTLLLCANAIVEAIDANSAAIHATTHRR